MSIADMFGWSGRVAGDDELPEIFPISITQNDFVKTDVLNIYAKILTDVLERTQGLSDEQTAMLWDNCVKSEKTDGLVTLLAWAMTEKADLFLVYEKAVGVVRQATSQEQAQIRADYEKQAKSSVGVFVSFKNYMRSDMVKLYSGLEFCTVASLNKAMNLAKAVQFKMNDLRGSVSLSDSADVKAQAKAVATALSKGRDVLLDAKDEIATSQPDLASIKEAIEFLDKKRSFYLGMPESYINGIQTGGLGTTGENDTKAIERGLKNYYFAVIKPVIEAVFGVKIKYKSQDFRQIAGSMEVIKTFALVDDTLISADNKRMLINALLDLPADAEGDLAPEQSAEVVPPPAAEGNA